MEFSFVIESDHWKDPDQPDLTGQIKIDLNIAQDFYGGLRVDEFVAHYAGSTFKLSDLHPADAAKALDAINDYKSQYLDYLQDMRTQALEMKAERDFEHYRDTELDAKEDR